MLGNDEIELEWDRERKKLLLEYIHIYIHIYIYKYIDRYINI